MGRRWQRISFGDAVFEGINHLVMLALCFITLYPIWYVLINSLNEGGDALRGGIYWWPRMFTLDNYIAVFRDNGIMLAMGVTVAKTVIGTALHVLFTAMVAYAFSRRELLGRKVYMGIGTITLFFGGGLIPTFLLFRDLGLLDTFWVYIIPVMFNFFHLLIFLAYFRDFPEGLEEAAKIDGANDLTVFYKIMLPISMPVVATIALFHGVYQWNDYFTGVIFINNNDLHPIQTFLYRIVTQAATSEIVDTTSIEKSMTMLSVKLATMVVTTLPIVVVYPFLQKYFVKGLMIGSMKG
ncbi:ABC transporter permease [Paenibacillus swuensis]|uniref:ABC transporter permease n=1 Tax=Paenibacillus swuensis TaxID=1178515 RepID=A0A172TET7_9BACL|nr:carbohydrate ABC transporter permease [Paenibacillus swuensis]ANE45551.1 ABC transporter permease [Paenibacillus swuensis]